MIEPVSGGSGAPEAGDGTRDTPNGPGASRVPPAADALGESSTAVRALLLRLAVRQ